MGAGEWGARGQGVGRGVLDPQPPQQPQHHFTDPQHGEGGLVGGGDAPWAAGPLGLPPLRSSTFGGLDFAVAVERALPGEDARRGVGDRSVSTVGWCACYG